MDEAGTGAADAGIGFGAGGRGNSGRNSAKVMGRSPLVSFERIIVSDDSGRCSQNEPN